MRTFIPVALARYLGFSFLCWAGVTFINVLSVFYRGSKFMQYDQFPLAYIMFIALVMTHRHRWVPHWRRSSRSIQNFWLGLILFSVCGVVINTLAAVALSWIFGDEPWLLSRPLAEVLWLFLVVILGYLWSMIDIKAAQQRIPKQGPLRVIVGLVVMYSICAIVGMAFLASHLLGYLSLAVVLVIFLPLHETVRDSIPSRARRQIIATALTIFCLAAGGTYILEKWVNPSSSFVASSFVREKPPVGEFLSARTASDWLAKAEIGVDSLSADEFGAALLKLEELCPSKPTDEPIRIRCTVLSQGSTSFTLFRKVDEKEIRQLLAGKGVYQRLFGVVEAKGLSEFSQEVKNQLLEISQTAGRLSPIAAATLAKHGAKKWANVSISAGPIDEHE